MLRNRLAFISIASSLTYYKRKMVYASYNRYTIADAADHIWESVVGIKIACGETNEYSSGSGVVINKNGTILTNAHILSDMTNDSKMIVTDSNSNEYEATVTGIDLLSDLAIVNIDSSEKEWKEAILAANLLMRPGEWCVAIGSPHGLNHTVTAGVISCTSRKSTEIGGAIDSPIEFIQTDCAIAPGSSGGPLINLDGHVIGIITSKADASGISFAIRIDNIISVIQQLMRYGKVNRPWMGIKMKKSKEPLGVQVENVVSNSPASQSGVLSGDVIVAIDDIPVKNPQQVIKHIGYRVGETIEVAILRKQALETEWDGRVHRHEIEQLNLKIKLGDLNEYLIKTK